MKTKLLALSAFLFISAAAMAQFHLGVKGGANIMKVDGKSSKTNSGMVMLSVALWN